MCGPCVALALCVTRSLRRRISCRPLFGDCGLLMNVATSDRDRAAFLACFPRRYILAVPVFFFVLLLILC